MTPKKKIIIDLYANTASVPMWVDTTEYEYVLIIAIFDNTKKLYQRAADTSSY